MQRRWLFVDGNHVASRARHSKGLAELRTSTGVMTGVLCGILKSIHWACNLSNLIPTQVVVFWDGGRATGRMQLYPEYKAGRKAAETPLEQQELQEYKDQCDRARLGMSLLGSRQVKVSGAEADDLIAIAAAEADRNGDFVIILSGDKDLHQCVTDNVVVFHEDGNLTRKSVGEKWGIADPKSLPELRAFMGDDSDNIVGVRGLGPKKSLLLFPFRHLVFSADDVSAHPLCKLISSARECSNIVDRNYRLMKLPEHFGESFYGIGVAEDYAAQMATFPTRRTTEFMAFCRKWELASILDTIGAW